MVIAAKSRRSKRSAVRPAGIWSEPGCRRHAVGMARDAAGQGRAEGPGRAGTVRDKSRVRPSQTLLNSVRRDAGRCRGACRVPGLPTGGHTGRPGRAVSSPPGLQPCCWMHCLGPAAACHHARQRRRRVHSSGARRTPANAGPAGYRIAGLSGGLPAEARSAMSPCSEGLSRSKINVT